MAFPTIRVYIAFGYTASDAAPVWTDITAYYFEAHIKRGQINELAEYQAGTCTVILDNASRRFDPSYAAGPLYGQLLPMVPMKIEVDAVVVFRGVVERWPLTYLQGGYESHIAVDCVDLLAVLSLRNRVDYRVITDSFDRADAASLGTADKGGAWTEYRLTGNSKISADTGQIRQYPAFSDGFTPSLASLNGTSADTVGGTWTVSSGTMYRGFSGGASASNYLGSGSPVAGTYIATVETSNADGILLTDPQPQPGIGQGWIIWRYVDDNNFWFLRYRLPGGIDYRVFKRVAGVDTQVGATVSTTITAPRVILSGNTFSVVDSAGTVRITGTDAFNNTATKHGIGAFVDATYTGYTTWLSWSFIKQSIALLDAGANGAGGAMQARMLVASYGTAGQGYPALIFRATDANNYSYLQVTGDIPFTVAIGNVINGAHVLVANYTVHATNPASYGDLFGGNTYGVEFLDGNVNPFVSYWVNNGGVNTLESYTAAATPSAFNQTATLHGIGVPWVNSGPAVTAGAFKVFEDFVFWTGRPVEKAGARISGLLDLAGYPTALRTIADGNFLLATISTPESPTSVQFNVLAQIKAAAAADGGRFYIAKDGKATFEALMTRSIQTRSVTTQATFGEDWSAGEIPYENFEAWLDDRDIINYMAVSGISGTDQVVEDGESQGVYLFRPSNLDTILLNDSDAKTLAGITVTRYANPRARVAALPLASHPNYIATYAGLEISDRVVVNRRPGGGTVNSYPSYVESIAIDIGPGARLAASILTSPASLGTFWILGVAGSSELGVTTILA